MKNLAIGGGKTNEMQGKYTILSLIARSIVLALCRQQNLGWGAGTRVHPFLAGARRRVNSGGLEAPATVHPLAPTPFIVGYSIGTIIMTLYVLSYKRFISFHHYYQYAFLLPLMVSCTRKIP